MAAVCASLVWVRGVPGKNSAPRGRHVAAAAVGECLPYCARGLLLRPVEADWRFRACPSLDEVKKHGIQLQTLGYRAPEVLWGDVRYGKPVDVFSYGAIVMELSGVGWLNTAKSHTWTAWGFGVTLMDVLGSPPPDCELRVLPLFPAAPPTFAGPRPYENKVAEHIGASGLEFVKQLVRWSPGERLTANEAAHHQFLNPCKLSLGGEAEASSRPTHGRPIGSQGTPSATTALRNPVPHRPPQRPSLRGRQWPQMEARLHASKPQ